MTEEPDDFDRLLGSLAKEGRLQPDPDPEEHPDSGTLYAYHEGRLSPEERTQVEEHLSICGRCRDLLVEYKEFAEDPVEEGEPEGRGRVADFGAAADWHRLREKIRVEGRTQRVDAAYEPGTPRRFFRSLRTAYSIAAVLALAVVGLSLYTVNQYRLQGQPRLNSGWYQLSGVGSSRIGTSDTIPEIPFQDGRAITFEIPAPEADPQTIYRLETYHEDKLLYKGRGLKIQQDEEDPIFRFIWEPHGLEPGEYEFRISRRREGEREELGRYPFKLVEQ